MEQFIKQYLQEHQSLALSGLGQFALQYKSSEIHPILHTFTVPGVYVVFDANVQIETTKDFVDFVAKQQQCSVQEANIEVDKYVQTILDKFHNGESCAIGEMGTFIRNRIGQLDFEASLDSDLSSESFGLEGFEWKNTLIDKQTDKPTEESTPISQKQEQDAIQDKRQTTSVAISENTTENEESKDNGKNTNDTAIEIEEKPLKKERGCGFKILMVIVFILLLLVILAIVGNLFYPQKIGEWRKQIEIKYEQYFGQNTQDTSSVLPIDTSSVVPIGDVEPAVDTLLHDSIPMEVENMNAENEEQEQNQQTVKTDEQTIVKGFYVVLGSFQDEENANNYLNEKRSEYANVVNLGKGRTSNLILIGIGPYSKEEAQQMITNQKIKGWLLQK